MQPIYLTYLNRFDVEAAALTDEEILAAVEVGLARARRLQPPRHTRGSLRASPRPRPASRTP